MGRSLMSKLSQFQPLPDPREKKEPKELIEKKLEIRQGAFEWDRESVGCLDSIVDNLEDFFLSAPKALTKSTYARHIAFFKSYCRFSFHHTRKNLVIKAGQDRIHIPHDIDINDYTRIVQTNGISEALTLRISKSWAKRD